MKKHLSQILKENFGISKEDYSDAKKLKKEQNTGIGEILVKKKIITETQLLEALSIQYDIPFLPKLSVDDIRNDFTKHVPIQFLKKYLMVPLEKNNASSDLENNSDQKDANNSTPSDDYLIAINGPACFQALDDLLRILQPGDFEVVFAAKDAILSVISTAYDQTRDSAQQLVRNMEEDGSAIISEIEKTADLLDDTSDAPIIKLVNHIISQSIKAKASDIHIEPYQDSFKVRYRIDGILYDLLTPPKWMQSSLISRIKVMAKMDIAEKRLPQDGRLEVKMGNQDIDIRVSTLPTSFGERVVLRLLNKSSSLLRLSDLG